MSDARWPLPLVRAVLDLAVLSCLESGPQHGYALANALDERGFGRLKGGSLYPVLARLEGAGFVSAQWVEADAGPGRKDYALTAEGRAHLAAGRQGLADLAVELGVDLATHTQHQQTEARA